MDGWMDGWREGGTTDEHVACIYIFYGEPATYEHVCVLTLVLFVCQEGAVPVVSEELPWLGQDHCQGDEAIQRQAHEVPRIVPRLDQRDTGKGPVGGQVTGPDQQQSVPRMEVEDGEVTGQGGCGECDRILNLMKTL